MADALAQLCQLIAEVLRDDPELDQAALVTQVEGEIAAHPELGAALKADGRILQVNRDRATGFQTQVAGGVANIGNHYHLATSKKGQAALATILQNMQKPEVEAINFERYLQSLVTTYQKWWEYYTLTDVTGQLQEPEPEKQRSPFDFGLMVQTIPKKPDPDHSEVELSQNKPGQTERLPILEGIRKYINDEHVLLIGRPGSGKSTALIRLLLELAQEGLEQSNGPIPILIELRYW